MTRLARSSPCSLDGLLPVACAYPQAAGTVHDGDRGVGRPKATQDPEWRSGFAPSRRRWDEPLENHGAWAAAQEGKAPEQAPASGAKLRPSIAEREIFEASVKPFLPQIYRVCLALCRDAAEAEDLLQNSLVKAFTHAASFQGRSDLFGWICGIVRNEHIETVRTRLRRFSLLDAVLDGCAAVLGTLFTGGSESPNPEERAIHSEQWDTLLACMRALPEDYRMVVLLCDVEEFSYERVSEILEIPIGTVKSRHARGRAKLKEAFMEWERGTLAKEEQ